jgi:UDP-2,3-diacylglucosamine pyrophosphatase LpxH
MKRLHNTLALSLALVAIVAFSSCNRLDIFGMVVNRSDTEARVSDWLEWNEHNGMPVINNVPDTYRFYSCSDTHLSDDNSRLVAYITAERNDPQAAFSLIVGDIANESGERPYILCDSAMVFHPASQAKNDPCFPIIGNHDVYYDCAKYFKSHFHTSTYAVVVKTQGGDQDLYLMLDSGNGTHGDLQTEWLEKQLANRSQYRHCFVISHNWLFRTTYNYTTTPAANLPEDEQYAFMDLMSRSGVDLVIMGHFHYSDAKTFGGVKYVMTNNLNDGEEKPSCMIVTCGDRVTYDYQELTLQ